MTFTWMSSAFGYSYMMINKKNSLYPLLPYKLLLIFYSFTISLCAGNP